MINKTFVEKTETVYTLVSITCDICKKEYKIDEVLDIQEFTYIRKCGGYDSVFGDEEKIECDICQNCLKKLLDGKYRIVT